MKRWVPMAQITMIVVSLLLAARLLATASADQPLVSRVSSGASEPPPLHLLLPQVYSDSNSILTTTPRPSWGAPIVVSPDDRAIWVVNPDAGSITSVDPDRLVTVSEIATGGEPWSLAIAPDGHRLYVVDRANGLLVVVDAQSHSIMTTIEVGPEPGSIALSPSGKTAYIPVSAANTVAVVDLQSTTVVTQIAVAPLPFAVAMSNDGDREDTDEQVYVTHLLALPRRDGLEATDDGREGRVTVIDPKRSTISQEITLLPDEHGFPNLLNSISISGKWAWIPQVRSAPALPNGLTTTVFAAVSAIHRGRDAEDSAASLSLNDEQVFGSPVNKPIAAIPSPDGT